MSKKRKCCSCIIFCVIVWLSGCSIEKTDSEKVKDLDFTMVEESKIPEELAKIIEEKKKEKFNVTFLTKEELYIVVGYGTQLTNGYSISVEELYLTSNAIYIDTNLIGPGKGEEITKGKSYPYIVLKTKNIDENVVFH